MPTFPKIHSSEVVTEVALRLALATKLRRDQCSFAAVLASEARYGLGDRRADFLSLTDVSHAYEIKSDLDSMARLPAQMQDYAKVFDFVTVVTTRKHLKAIRNLVSKKAGIWVLHDGVLTVQRNASQNRRLSKLDLASGCNKASLLRALSGSKPQENKESLFRSAAKTLSLAELQELFHNELRQRYSTPSKFFFRETDQNLNEEDLLLLRRAYRIAA